MRDMNQENNQVQKNKQLSLQSSRLASANFYVALDGILIALALVLSYLESLLPVFVAVPGVKIGLANIVTIFALRKLGVKTALTISVIRVALAGVLFSGVITIAYGLAGAFLSIFIMTFSWKVFKLGLLGGSVLGAVAHNSGQILMACLLFGTSSLMYYMAVLVVVGTISGVLVGVAAGYIIKNVRL